MNVSVILPVKEPEPYLERLKSRVSQELMNVAADWEILVQREKGLTNAVIAGVKAAKFDTILVMDADGQHDPQYIPQLLSALQQGYDIAIGSRQVFLGFPWYRRAISNTLNFAASNLLHRKLSDAMTGYVAARKEVFKHLKPSLSYKFLLQLLNNGYTVKEVPIVFQPRQAGESKATFSTGLRAVLQVAAPLKFYLPVIAALFFSTALALYYLKPIGADIHFHWQIAQAWSQGQIGMFSKVALDMNKMPYPPLLHLVLAPAFWFNVVVPWTLVLQVVLYPLCVYTVMKATWHLGRLYSALAAFLVLGAFAFSDRLIQVQPQALTMVLFPLAFYYRKSPWKFVAISALMVWTHGFIALPLLLGLWAFSLWLDSDDKQIPLTHVSVFALSTAPITLPSLYMIAGGISHFFGSGYENAQEAAFWSSPTFTLLYMRLLLLGFPVVVYKFAKWREATAFEKEAAFTIVGMIPLLFWQADRFLQYSTIPLAFLLASLAKRSRPNVREGLFWVTLIFFLFMYVTLWLMLVGNGFDIQ